MRLAWLRWMPGRPGDHARRPASAPGPSQPPSGTFSQSSASLYCQVEPFATIGARAVDRWVVGARVWMAGWTVVRVATQCGHAETDQSRRFGAGIPGPRCGARRCAQSRRTSRASGTAAVSRRVLAHGSHADTRVVLRWSRAGAAAIRCCHGTLCSHAAGSGSRPHRRSGRGVSAIGVAGGPR